MSKCQIPCDCEDHDAFRIIAANEHMTMKDLFHKWVDDYQKSQIAPNKQKLELYS